MGVGGGGGGGIELVAKEGKGITHTWQSLRSNNTERNITSLNENEKGKLWSNTVSIRMKVQCAYYNSSEENVGYIYSLSPIQRPYIPMKLCSTAPCEYIVLYSNIVLLS